MIQIEIQEWQEMKAKMSQLGQELVYLRNQNQLLKRKLNFNSNLPNQSSSSQSSICLSQHIKHKYSKPDAIVQSQNSVHDQHSKLPPKLYGKYLSLDFQRNPPLSDRQSIDYSSVQMQKSLSNQDQNSITVSRKSHQQMELKNLITSNKSSQQQIRNQLHLIQQICVFGPSLSQQILHQVTFKNDQKQFVQPALYYPKHKSSYQHYGSYMYPKKCRVKPTQRSHIPVEGNKILFKSSKKPDCNIFIFQGNEKLHPIKKPHQMLQNVNPSKWLYGIVIEFSDFVFQEFQLKQPDKKGSSSEDLEQIKETQSPTIARDKRKSLLELDMRSFFQQQIRMQTVSLKDIELQSQKVRMYRSTFSLCIFTYFPFVDYLQSIISAIFDQVKLNRIQRFPQTGDFKDCDIFYFIKEVDAIAEKIKIYFYERPVKMGKEMSLSINQTELYIDLTKEELYKKLYCNWALKLIKIMDKEVFYEIYCMIMLEESVTFVCENRQLLTFMILMFASMLTKPFVYPYPVVSILFTQQLLQTPFTSIVGINQSQQWLEQAIEQKVLDSQNKQIIMVTQRQVRIKRTEGFKVPKSQRLRKVFSKFYKKTEPSSLTAILMKTDSLLRMNSLPVIQPRGRQSSQHVVNFFAKLQIFYHQNIFAYLPNSVKLWKKEEYQGEGNKVVMRNDFLEEIENQYKMTNPEYVKDEFVKKFIETQIFSIYLMNEYQLDA